MPTPIKYGNPQLKQAYKAVERETAAQLVSMLPDYMQQSYSGFFVKDDADSELWKLVKAADKMLQDGNGTKTEIAQKCGFYVIRSNTGTVVRNTDQPASAFL